jgi:hypothetical protein
MHGDPSRVNQIKRPRRFRDEARSQQTDFERLAEALREASELIAHLLREALAKEVKVLLD